MNYGQWYDEPCVGSIQKRRDDETPSFIFRVCSHSCHAGLQLSSRYTCGNGNTDLISDYAICHTGSSYSWTDIHTATDKYRASTPYIYDSDRVA